MSRLTTALKVRDHLLPLLNKHGTMLRIGTVPACHFAIGAMTVTLRGSFAALGENPGQEQLLEVRYGGERVFALYWQGCGEYTVRKFQRGSWEEVIHPDGFRFAT